MLFLDIGGVLLSDGWDHHASKRAATNFKLELAEMEDRHHLAFETYDEGKLTIVHPGSVSPFHVRAIEALPEMIELIARHKVRHGLKVGVVNSEVRELNANRIQRFKLDGFVDFFVSSCFDRLRKPDADIFRIALDIAKRQPVK